MKVRLLKDWNYHKTGEVVDIFEPTARSWVTSGIAEVFQPRQELVEQAVASYETAERAVVSRKVSKK